MGQALGIRAGEHDFTIFRDLENGLEYIRPSRELASDGLFFVLEAYQHHSFIDFREIEDEGGKWKKVCAELNGGGYWSIQARFDEINIQGLIVEGKESSPNKIDEMGQKVSKRADVIKRKLITEKITSK